MPQFIDAEDKILGPLTARQFIELVVTFLITGVLFKLVPFIWFLVIGIPIFSLGVVLTFVPINGQPFHYFLLNVIQTFRRPRLRVWDKQRTDGELRNYIEEITPLPAPAFVHKAALSQSRLQELSLVVNTGGVYKPEE